MAVFALDLFVLNAFCVFIFISHRTLLPFVIYGFHWIALPFIGVANNVTIELMCTLIFVNVQSTDMGLKMQAAGLVDRHVVTLTSMKKRILHFTAFCF